jgi:protein tyrosine/serine phosphatase
VTETLTFDSLFNFRDVGGCGTVNGGAVRRGLLFRSDTLVKITDDDLARLSELRIRTVIDLRRNDEVERYGRVADADGRRYHHMPPTHPLWEDSDFDETAGVARYLADRYLELAEHGTAGIATVLRLLAEPQTTPAVVHCFAGKDRTGVVIALTLALLGVDDSAIADDYARSEEWSRTNAPTDLPVHWTLAPREAMILFLTGMRERYGSIERYATNAGVTADDVAALRSALLNS